MPSRLLLPPGAPTISTTPRSATTIARQARRVIASRSANHAINAAPIGAAAWRKKTFATVAWLSATMNDPEATAVQTATARPAAPIERKAWSVRRRLTATTKTPSASNAKTARPASCVIVSTESSLCSTPALDQARAAPATYSCPRRRSPAQFAGRRRISSVNHPIPLRSAGPAGEDNERITVASPRGNSPAAAPALGSAFAA